MEPHADDATAKGRWKMELLHPRCCGLDVQKVVACLRLVSVVADSKPCER
jgi:hypothetical protein